MARQEKFEVQVKIPTQGISLQGQAGECQKLWGNQATYNSDLGVLPPDTFSPG